MRLLPLQEQNLFFDFVYEVVREKMIIGNNELADSDVRIFFKDKQQQNEKAAGWTDETLNRLGRCYKTMLYEAGITDKVSPTGREGTLGWKMAWATRQKKPERYSGRF